MYLRKRLMGAGFIFKPININSFPSVPRFRRLQNIRRIPCFVLCALHEKSVIRPCKLYMNAIQTTSLNSTYNTVGMLKRLTATASAQQ